MMSNNKKNILILRSNSVNPDSRVEKEAECLAKAGYKVHIYAWDRDSNHNEQTGHLKENQNICITRDGFRKIRQYISYQLAIRSYIRKHNNEIDIIHACDFDTAFSSYKLAKRLGKKFIFDVFDFICGEPKNIFQNEIKKAQIRIINSSDATIICTEERKDQIQDAKPKKLCVIHNSPPIIACERLETENSYLATIVYVGILQDYRLLIEIADFFKSHREYKLNIAGFGKYEGFFLNLDKEYNNISFYGRIEYEDALKLEQQADIMLAIYDPSIENHRYAAPNKFYESLMLGKPIIMVKGTGMSQIVSENQVGAIIDYSAEGFSKGVSELLEKKDKWLEMSKRMKELYKERYSWNEMSQRLINLYKELSE